MKEIIKIALIVLCSIEIQAQEALNSQLDTLKSNISILKSSNSYLKSEIINLDSKLSDVNNRIDSLLNQTLKNSTVISQRADELDNKIKETGDKNDGKITEVSNSLSKNSLYSIIGVLTAILLSGLIYWLLSKRQQSDKTKVEEQLTNAKKAIDQEQIQINTKLAELYNGQMELLRMERKANTNAPIDHSLALKVADEIVKMQMNLAHMDSKVKGHKPLTIAVNNVIDNFRANGYEITDLLNKPYKEGMNLQATMEPDPNLNEGEQIIRRIIKPEIYYNNKIIQHAQVIVAYGE